MNTGLPDAVIFVLVDALRHDYVERTHFLRQLRSQSFCGELEEPFGFCPRAAYFGGLSVAQQGFTNMFRYDPRNSAFRWVRALTGGDDAVRARDRYRAAIVSRAREQLSAWAGAYVDPLAIPLSRLPSFDLSEQHAPWSDRVGYRSVFHILDDNRQAWLQVSWPFQGGAGPAASARIAGDALAALRPEHRFAFVHLPDLDSCGHTFGPGSRELQRDLEETDRLCELIVARATELFRDPVIVFAGDHGMLPVVRTVDAEDTLTRTRLRWGHDIAYFIDSTMVRCWFFTNAARCHAMAALSSLGGGHFVSDDEQDRFELRGIDPRNGEALFLADPGVVFSPSYFDWSGQHTPRGMHGYAPDVADNRAALLIHRPGDNACGEVGVIAARRLFPTFLLWLGIDYRPLTGIAPILSLPAPARARWTPAGDAGSERLIDAHVTRITAVLQERAPEADAIILTGSFGRGEGTVVSGTPSGGPLNDYDLIVVGADRARLDGVGAALAREFDIDFVDITVVPTLEASESPSQFDYDVRYGSRVIAGNQMVLDRLPRYAPAQISRDEGALQVGNRMGGLLLGLTECFVAVDSAERFLTRQTMKFLIAVADCWLIVGGDYHPSYRVRRERFGALAGAAGFSRAVATSVDRAFAAKLGDSPPAVTNAEASAAAALAALCELERSLDVMDTPFVLDTALECGVRLRMSAGSREWLGRARAFGLCATSCAIEDPPRGVAVVYDACLRALRSWADGPDERGARVQAALAPCFIYRPEGLDTGVLPAVAHSWLSLFH